MTGADADLFCDFGIGDRLREIAVDDGESLVNGGVDLAAARKEIARQVVDSGAGEFPDFLGGLLSIQAPGGFELEPVKAARSASLQPARTHDGEKRQGQPARFVEVALGCQDAVPQLAQCPVEPKPVAEAQDSTDFREADVGTLPPERTCWNEFRLKEDIEEDKTGGRSEVPKGDVGQSLGV